METPFGRIRCTMKGVPKAERPIILTMHDIGLNRKPRPPLPSVAASVVVVLQAVLIWIPLAATSCLLIPPHTHI